MLSAGHGARKAATTGLPACLSASRQQPLRTKPPLQRTSSIPMDHSSGFLAHVEARRALVHEVSVADAQTALAADETARLFDVREDREWMAGHAANASHLARGVMERDIEGLVPDKATPLYLYCGGGFRSALASDSLQKMGYTNVHSIAGGWRAWTEAGAPMEGASSASRVTGVGGVFFRSSNPEATRAWYSKHLGISSQSWGAVFPFREHDAPQVEGFLAWSVSPENTTYFGESGQRFMLNYRVRDLDALLEQLRAEGVTFEKPPENSELGKFGWIRDGDGNRVELWQPPR